MRLRVPPGDLVAPLVFMAIGGALTWLAAVIYFMPSVCRERWYPAETRYTLIGGCTVKRGDRFVPDHFAKETEEVIEEQVRSR